jgi:hypothetical protein
MPAVRYNHYGVSDLTRLGVEDEPGPYEDLVLCVACDVGMIKSFNDIISPDNNRVLVKKGQYYCRQCGVIQEDDTNTNTNIVATTITKKLETTGPRIQQKKPSDNVLFKSIRYDDNNNNTGYKSFDIDPGDDEMYKAQGFHIVSTKITGGDGRVLRRD